MKEDDKYYISFDYVVDNQDKKCYYKKIILNQNKIRNDEITVEQFAEFLPTVSVEVNIQASPFVY